MRPTTMTSMALAASVAVTTLTTGVALRAQRGALCEPIHVMEGLSGRSTMALAEMGGFVSDPGPTQREFVEKARQLMTPFVCAAVRRVAFIDTDNENVEGWVSGTRPDLIHLPESLAGERLLHPLGRNWERRTRTLHSLVHEATHAASNLLKEYDASADEETLQSKGGQLLFGSDAWTDAGRTEARRIAEQNRLRRGLYAEWEALHQSFVKAGLARPYHGEGSKHIEPEVLQAHGFMTGYGGDKAGEDIAEFTAAIRTRSIYADERGAGAPRDVACQVMRQQPGPGVPDRLTPFFTKVGFLHSIGFISDDDYDYCVGTLRIRGDGNGIFSFDDGIRVHEYLGSPRAKIGRAPKSNAWMFEFEADGTVTSKDKTIPVTARLQLALAPGDRPLEQVSFPRGRFQIAYGAGGHSFQIVTKGAKGDQIVLNVEQGVVLVSRASASLIEGSVVIQRASDRTSLLPLPEIHQNRVMTFRKENRLQ